MIEEPSTPPPPSYSHLRRDADPVVLHSRPRLHPHATSTTIEISPPTPSSDASSPRTAVASRLSDLSLRTLNFESIGSIEQRSPRKRARSASVESVIRRADESRDEQEYHSMSTYEHHEGDQKAVQNGLDPRPGHGPSVNSANTANLNNPGATKSSPMESAILVRRRISARPKLKRKKSPPPRSSGTGSENDANTWQDHEITGHLLDDPQDDGYGINGIGFRPTTAIAYARSQKRRQQIDEWRARESKDARQVRSERRRHFGDGQSRTPSFTEIPNDRGSVDEERETSTKKRSVRFV